MNIDLYLENARINEFISINKLKLTHFRYSDGNGILNNRGGMTVIWREIKPGRVFSVATAICNKNDIFSKTMGKIIATQNFEQGHVIYLMADKYYTCYGIISKIFIGEDQ